MLLPFILWSQVEQFIVLVSSGEGGQQLYSTTEPLNSLRPISLVSKVPNDFFQTPSSQQDIPTYPPNLDKYNST